MINSMTAFSRETARGQRYNLTVELRTVNHRFFDALFKLPDALRPLEGELRDAARRHIARGRLECWMRLETGTDADAALQVDEQHAARVVRAAEAIGGLTAESAPLDPLAVLQFPGVLAAPEPDEESLHRDTLALFSQACSKLGESRQREGEKLQRLIEDRLARIDGEVAPLRANLPALLQHQQRRLQARVAELGAELDPERLEQEVAYMAQKADVAEELDRLEAHIGEVRRTLEKGGPCGRRLDFLMQELNREANTLSSKSVSSESSHAAVEIKVLIEQMREQVQNIE